MPFQPINFAAIPPQGNPAMRDLLRNILSGYQAAKLPEQMQQESLARSLQNKISQITAAYLPRQMEADLQGKNASNQLTDLNRQALNMQVNPDAKVAYINKLISALSPGGSVTTTETQFPTMQEGGATSGNGQLPLSDLQVNKLKDAFLKKELGIPVNYESPEQKQMRDIQTALAKKKGEIDLDTIKTLESDASVLRRGLERIQEMKDIAEKKPHFFGPGFMGWGPGWREWWNKDEDLGVFTNLQSDLLASFEKELSSRGSNQALKSAERYKPAFKDTPATALGKIKSLEKKVLNSLSEANKKYYKLKGEPLTYSDEDVEYTAKKQGMTPQQVRQILEQRRR